MLEKIIDIDNQKCTLNGVEFNPFDFGSHKKKKELTTMLLKSGEKVLKIDGKNFHHLSLWSLSEFTEPKDQANLITDHCCYTGDYVFCLLSKET